ncbi:hypothetical protein BDR06DRAFT_912791, partial [Suillus hirtellus]
VERLESSQYLPLLLCVLYNFRTTSVRAQATLGGVLPSAAELAEVPQHRLSPLVSNKHHITCSLLISNTNGVTQVSLLRQLHHIPLEPLIAVVC